MVPTALRYRVCLFLVLTPWPSPRVGITLNSVSWSPTLSLYLTTYMSLLKCISYFSNRNYIICILLRPVFYSHMFESQSCCCDKVVHFRCCIPSLKNKWTSFKEFYWGTRGSLPLCVCACVCVTANKDIMTIHERMNIYKYPCMHLLVHLCQFFSIQEDDRWVTGHIHGPIYGVGAYYFSKW